MPLNWLDTTHISFNALLLLESVQISWLPGSSLDEADMALALHANPAVAWFLHHKCPEVVPWLERLPAPPTGSLDDPQAVHTAEQRILQALNDWLVYVLEPAVYASQPFLNWDSSELTRLIDFSDKIVLDIGAGTGRLAFVAAPRARQVICVEPVGNLRRYITHQARQMDFRNVYAIEGLITEIPLPDDFADVALSGHVFGDLPEQECDELERVVRSGAMVILCPGNNDHDNQPHQVLVQRGYSWSRFEEPRDGWKRKYWKTVS